MVFAHRHSMRGWWFARAGLLAAVVVKCFRRPVRQGNRAHCVVRRGWTADMRSAIGGQSPAARAYGSAA